MSQPPASDSADPVDDSQAPAVHLVIPAFRESERIGGYLDDLGRELADLPGIALQVVDDGSGEPESAAMARLVEERQVAIPFLRPIHHLTPNRGKGGAVRAGWDLFADADAGDGWLGFVDADGATPAREVRRLVELARARAAGPGGQVEALFASRIRMLGRRVDRLVRRHLTGRVFATMVSNLLDIEAYDTQCGCKLVPVDAYRRVRPVLQCNGFAFDVELLAALLDSGCEVREEPVDWAEIPGGKVSLVRDSWRMFADLLEIRRRRRGWGSLRDVEGER